MICSDKINRRLEHLYSTQKYRQLIIDKRYVSFLYHLDFKIQLKKLKIFSIYKLQKSAMAVAAFLK